APTPYRCGGLHGGQSICHAMPRLKCLSALTSIKCQIAILGTAAIHIQFAGARHVPVASHSYTTVGVGESVQTTQDQVVGVRTKRTAATATLANENVISAPAPSTNRSGSIRNAIGAPRIAAPPPITAAYQGTIRHASALPSTSATAAVAIEPNRTS